MERIKDKVFRFEINLTNGDLARLTICPSFYDGDRFFGSANPEVITFDKGFAAGLFELKTMKLIDYSDSEASIPYGFDAGAELVLSFNYSEAIKLITDDNNELFSLVESFFDSDTPIPEWMDVAHEGNIPTLLQLELFHYPYAGQFDTYQKKTFALKNSVSSIESTGTSEFIFQNLPEYALNTLDFRSAWSYTVRAAFATDKIEEHPFCIQEHNRATSTIRLQGDRLLWDAIPFLATKAPFDYPKKQRSNEKAVFSNLEKNIIYSDWNNMIYGHAIVNWTGSFYYLDINYIFNRFFYMAERYMYFLAGMFRNYIISRNTDECHPLMGLFSKQKHDGSGGSEYVDNNTPLRYCVSASQVKSIEVDGSQDFVHVPKFGIIPKFNTKQGRSSEDLLPSDDILKEGYTSNMQPVWAVLDFDNVLEFLIATCKQFAVQGFFADSAGVASLQYFNEWGHMATYNNPRSRAATTAQSIDATDAKYTASVGENCKPTQFSFAGFSKSNGDLEFFVAGNKPTPPYNIDVYSNNVPKKQLDILRGVWNTEKTQWIRSDFEILSGIDFTNGAYTFDYYQRYGLPFAWVGGTSDHAKEYHDWCIYGFGGGWIGGQDQHLETQFADVFLLDAKFDLDIYMAGERVSNLINHDGVFESPVGLGATIKDSYKRENNHAVMPWGASIFENRSLKIDSGNNSWHIMASEDLLTTERIDAVTRQFVTKTGLVQSNGVCNYLAQFFDKWAKNSVQVELLASADRGDSLMLHEYQFPLFELAVISPQMHIASITSTMSDYFTYSNIFNGVFFPFKMEIDFQNAILTINYSKWKNEN